MHAIPLASFDRNVFQDGDGGPFFRMRYLSTVALHTVIPSFASSPMIRGVPQVGLAQLMSRISFRISGSILARPGLLLWRLRVQNCRNRLFCQSMIVRGWAMTKTFRHPSVILEKRTQKSRSESLNCGLFAFRFKTANC